MELNHKLKLLALTQHLIGILGIFYYGVSAVTFFVVLFFYFLYFGVGISAGFHRLICHKSYQCADIVKKILLIIGTLSGAGSSVAWVLSHRLHHLHSDKNISMDPYYPQGNFWSKIKAWIVTPRNVPYNPLIIKDVLKDKFQLFLHRHYFKFIWLYVILLAIVNPWLVVFAWAVPNILSYHAMQSVGVLSHTYGKKIHDTHDNSRNNLVVGILTFGEGFQNTHHKYPYNFNFDNLDLIGLILEKLRKNNIIYKH
jgi:stearoyl-CoA desaturase (delta-9 desaturase)